MTPAEAIAKRKREERAKGSGRSEPRQRSIQPQWNTRLREHRIRLDLTLRDVAVAIGTSDSHLRDIEAGVSDPYLSTAIKLAAFFGCSIGDLWLEYTPREKPPVEKLPVVRLAPEPVA